MWEDGRQVKSVSIALTALSGKFATAEGIFGKTAWILSRDCVAKNGFWMIVSKLFSRQGHRLNSWKHAGRQELSLSIRSLNLSHDLYYSRARI